MQIIATRGLLKVWSFRKQKFAEIHEVEIYAAPCTSLQLEVLSAAKLLLVVETVFNHRSQNESTGAAAV